MSPTTLRSLLSRCALVLLIVGMHQLCWRASLPGALVAADCCFNEGCMACSTPSDWCAQSPENCVNCRRGYWCEGGEPTTGTTLDTTPSSSTTTSMVAADDCDENSIPEDGPIAGSLTITINNQPVTYFVVQSGYVNGRVSTTSNSISMQHGQRAYLTPRCRTQLVPDIFEGINLLGGTISFTVDVNHVGCGCNAAFYGVEMPGRKSNGDPDPGDCDDYYCDGAGSCGVYCEEIDIMEANTHAFHTATHSCPTEDEVFYPSCGPSNCYTNTKYDGTVGPGPDYTINTLNPFKVSTTYHTDEAESLVRIETVLEQGESTLRRVQDDSTDCGVEMQRVSDTMRRGITLAMSYWGGSGSLMQWLDVPPCDLSEACAKDAAWTVKDIVISHMPCSSPANTENDCKSFCNARSYGYLFESLDEDGCENMCTCRTCDGFQTASQSECRDMCAGIGEGYSFAEEGTLGCANVCKCNPCPGVGAGFKKRCKEYCADQGLHFNFFLPIDSPTNCENRCFCQDPCPGIWARNDGHCETKCKNRGLQYYRYTASEGGSCTKRCICHTCPPEKDSLEDCQLSCSRKNAAFVSFNDIPGCINPCVCDY